MNRHIWAVEQRFYGTRGFFVRTGFLKRSDARKHARALKKDLLADFRIRKYIPEDAK